MAMASRMRRNPAWRVSTVQLFYDPDGNGVYDTLYPGGTTTTDQTGFYLFDNLPPGGYVVRVTPPGGYTQTGDPDTWGQLCTTCDNQTTTPVVIGPGDVFLNADFGYQPPASQNNSIGDKVWFDADADGIGPAGTPGGGDTNEYGIPGATVALIRDTNNNGIWNTGEPIIATDITDAGGMYLFTGLPDGSYLVWVNDTDNVLGAMTPTYDSDGGAPPPHGRTAERGIQHGQGLELRAEPRRGQSSRGFEPGAGLRLHCGGPAAQPGPDRRPGVARHQPRTACRIRTSLASRAWSSRCSTPTATRSVNHDRRERVLLLPELAGRHVHGPRLAACRPVADL